jgi:hypothetical protein
MTGMKRGPEVERRNPDVSPSCFASAQGEMFLLQLHFRSEGKTGMTMMKRRCANEERDQGIMNQHEEAGGLTYT